MKGPIIIQGNKPSNYTVYNDPSGKKVEGEMRMCAHCSIRWEYRPGSGKRRGYCKRCNGLLCGKDLCMQYCIPWIDKIDAMEKGLSLKELLKTASKKYGSIIVGKTRSL